MGKRQYRGSREAPIRGKGSVGGYFLCLFLWSVSLGASPMMAALSAGDGPWMILCGSLFWCGAIGTIVFGWRLLRGKRRSGGRPALLSLLAALGCGAGFALFGPVLSQQIPACILLGGWLLSVGFYLFFKHTKC